MSELMSISIFVHVCVHAIASFLRRVGDAWLGGGDWGEKNLKHIFQKDANSNTGMKSILYKL